MYKNSEYLLTFIGVYLLLFIAMHLFAHSSYFPLSCFTYGRTTYIYMIIYIYRLLKCSCMVRQALFCIFALCRYIWFCTTHCIVYCTTHCIVYCTIHCIVYCTTHYIVYCTIHCSHYLFIIY